MYNKQSVFERWLEYIGWPWKDQTSDNLDEAAAVVIKHEILELDARKERLVKLLGEPERLRAKKEAIALAEQMQANLREKRRKLAEGDSHLTEEEILARAQWRESLTPREKCKHLKGGFASRWGFDKFGGPLGSAIKDYNIGVHRFIDFSVKAWCLNGCGFESRPGDANWDETLRMIDSSTNVQSASESVPYKQPQSLKEVTVVVQDRIPVEGKK
jgi:hypothetical protein